MSVSAVFRHDPRASLQKNKGRPYVPPECSGSTYGRFLRLVHYALNEIQCGIHASDPVSGGGMDDMARTVAHQKQRQPFRLHISAPRRRLRGVLRKPDLRLRKRIQYAPQLLISKRLPPAQKKP